MSGIAIIIPGVDFSNKNLGTVKPVKKLISLVIVGADSVTTTNKSAYSVSYTPPDTSEKGVMWSVTSGGTYATIDDDGVLTVLDTAITEQNVTVRATSSANEAIFSEKTVTVKYHQEPAGFWEGDGKALLGYSFGQTANPSSPFYLMLNLTNRKPIKRRVFFGCDAEKYGIDLNTLFQDTLESDVTIANGKVTKEEAVAFGIAPIPCTLIKKYMKVRFKGDLQNYKWGWNIVSVNQKSNVYDQGWITSETETFNFSDYAGNEEFYLIGNMATIDGGSAIKYAEKDIPGLYEVLEMSDEPIS